MRYLITGGEGLIGSEIAKILVARGDEVTSVDIRDRGRLDDVPVARRVTADIASNPSSVQWGDTEREVLRSEYVFHCAATVGVEVAVTMPLETILNNVRSTMQILKACQLAGKPVMIFSSADVYGPRPGEVSEQDHPALGDMRMSRWSYCASKLLGEALAFAYQQERHVKVHVVRPFSVVGPGQDPTMVISKFIRKLLAGQEIEVHGEGTQTRCFMHVWDAAAAFVALADEAPFGDIYNVGNPEPMAIRDLAAAVCHEVQAVRRGQNLQIPEPKWRLVPYTDAMPKGFQDVESRTPIITKLRPFVGGAWPSFNVFDVIAQSVAHEVKQWQLSPSS